MEERFDVEIDLNGWLIPIQVEQKGSGIFKVTYGNTSLGLLIQSETSKWTYVQNLFSRGLLNKLTTDKISFAIRNY